MEKKQQRKKRWLVVLGSLVGAILLLTVIVLFYYNAKLNLIQYDNTQDGSLAATGQNASTGNLVISQPEQPVSEPVPPVSTAEPVQESDVTNILLLGTNEWGALSDTSDADTLMILSINTKLHTAKLVSIQYHVEIEDAHGQQKVISKVFAIDGASGIMQLVETYFGVPVDCYMRVNYTTFSDGIDVLGGVDINLDQREVDALNGDIFTNATTRHRVQVGVNHLDGYDALQYCRLRYTDCDCTRNTRQRAVIQAAINKAQSEDIFTLDKLANTALPLLQTNMSKQEITGMLLEIPGFLSAGASVQQFGLPAKDTYTEIIRENGNIVVVMDFEENAGILHDYLYSAGTA